MHLTEALLLAPACEDDTQWSGEPLAGFLFDAENAFNSLHRSTMLAELFKAKEFQSIWRFADWAYRMPSLLLAPGADGTIQFGVWSQQGVRQGDPLGSHLFSCAIHPTLILAEGSGAKILAFLDDINTIGTPQQLHETIAILVPALREIGLNMSITKSELLWFHEGGCPEALQEVAMEFGVAVETDAVKVLGCPIGRDRAKVAQMLIAQVEKHNQFFSALQCRAMSAQISMLLLRLCGAPKLNYLCRTATGVEMKEAATKFHEMMMCAFADRADILRPEIPQSQIHGKLVHLPLQFGGVGIPQIQSIRKLAWLGSFAASAETILSDPRFNTRVCGSTLVQSAVAEAVGQAHRMHELLVQAGAQRSAIVPAEATVAAALELYGSPPGPDAEPAAFALQRKLSKDLHEGEKHLAKQDMTVVQREILANFGRQHASAWMLARADEPQTTLTDQEVAISMRSRLLLRPVRLAHQFDKCPAPCGADLTNDASNHSLGCVSLKASWTIRHNMVAEPIARVFRMAGCVTKWVPFSGIGQSRGDLLVTPSGRGEYGGASLMLDFTFSHSLTRTRVQQHRYNNSVHHTLQSLEAAKFKAYQQADIEPGWTFYPMAGTTFGAIGDQASKCLGLLPKLAPEREYGEKLCQKAFIWWSVALQRGNAMVLLNGVYRANLANRHVLGQDQPRRRPGL